MAKAVVGVLSRIFALKSGVSHKGISRPKLVKDGEIDALRWWIRKILRGFPLKICSELSSKNNNEWVEPYLKEVLELVKTMHFLPCKVLIINKLRIKQKELPKLTLTRVEYRTTFAPYLTSQRHLRRLQIQSYKGRTQPNALNESTILTLFL